ncbi:hypothetical protein GC170_15120 [bacterium]|nr:hypothetical protein [bacterium]
MKRSQLTMFVRENLAGPIEAIRIIVDPVQHSLIPAHVTLCREDELEKYEGWRERLAAMPAEMILQTLRFGRAESFAGHGILLPCIEGIERFRILRQTILGSDTIRDARPHMTLAHPRNPKSPGNAIEIACGLPSEFEITFDTIRLIEQFDSNPWNVVETSGSNSPLERHESE